MECIPCLSVHGRGDNGWRDGGQHCLGQNNFYCCLSPQYVVLLFVQFLKFNSQMKQCAM